MKQSWFTETRIVAILQEAYTAAEVTEVCRKYGIIGNKFHNLKKKKYSGMGVPELKRIKELISKGSDATGTPGSAGKAQSDLLSGLHTRLSLHRQAVQNAEHS